MIFETLILTYIILKLKKIDLKNLHKLNFKKVFFAYLGVIIFLIMALLIRFNISGLSVFVVKYFYYLHIFSLVLLLGFTLFNIDIKGMFLVALGLFLNIVPILLNGYMPVSYEALLISADEPKISSIVNGYSLTHRVLENPKMWILSDIVPIPKPYFYARVISMGDILISIGLFVTIYYAATAKRN